MKIFEIVDDDGRTTNDGGWVYYKLTCRAFGSGELKRGVQETVFAKERV